MFASPFWRLHWFPGPFTEYAKPRLVVAAVSLTRSYHWDSPQLSAASKTRRTCPAGSTVTLSLIPLPASVKVSVGEAACAARQGTANRGQQTATAQSILDFRSPVPCPLSPICIGLII